MILAFNKFVFTTDYHLLLYNVGYLSTPQSYHGVSDLSTNYLNFFQKY
nr:MAG TPA: hypothetical protein [Caudoviricetes sp.]DAY74039.1 MAG TPA: hypothetical protein [Caudoviricetes sp.]